MADTRYELMNDFPLPYGHTTFEVVIPTSNLLGVLVPELPPVSKSEPDILRYALTHPIGTSRLCDIARPGQKVTLIISDMTRPCPSNRLLPPLLAELKTAILPAVRRMPVRALRFLLHCNIGSKPVKPKITVDSEVAIPISLFITT